MADKEKNTVGDGRYGPHNALVAPRGQKAIELPKEAPPNMDKFFGTKERTFWSFQAVGWAGYAVVRIFVRVTGGLDLVSFLGVIVAATIIGLIMSTGMRYIYRLALDLKLPALILLVILVCGFLGLIFSFLELSLVPIFAGGAPYVGLAKLTNAGFEASVLFAWSAIYFGYHYYQSLQEQKEQVLKATAMAHQAQLKMLRYQLNPHFLFNTLNAISTLVLEKSEKDANQMLTKLSSFLRYTLVNQPTQRITLEKELHALGLYLDIEKVRFQDRLVLEFDIEDKAKDALIPSLILQPLVENAIKYAIAPLIDGGTIKLSARVQDKRLHIALCDNGPGIEDISNIVSQTGSGVGIANTKERLQQIYGASHSIEWRKMEPSGLGIYIEVPCERETRT
jgi:two-component system, LytTR family, sensor kinase